jgi:hypothetical protein
MQLLDPMYRNGPFAVLPAAILPNRKPGLRLSNPTTPHATRPAGVLSEHAVW